MLLVLFDSAWSPSVGIFLCFQRADRFRNAIRRREQDLLAASTGFYADSNENLGE